MHVCILQVAKTVMYVGGRDYYERSYYYVRISAGVTTVPFSIDIYDDDILEGYETFYLYIHDSLPYNVHLGSTTGTTVTILDDDCEHLISYA